MVSGKKNVLCQRFKVYLESATDKDNIPPNCATSFGAEFPEFVETKWREVHPKDHPELSVQAYRYLNYWPWDRPYVGGFTDKQQIVDDVASKHRQGWWRMWLAEADIDNDGKPDKLLKIEDGRCGDRRPTPNPFDFRVPVMVLNDAGISIDTTKSELILGVSVLPPIPPYSVKGLHGIEDQVYDYFRSGDLAYFFRWSENWPIVVGKKYDRRYAAVTVYRIQHDRTDPVCRFKLTK